MKLELFDYDLPKSHIAQHPKDKRDHSKLLVVDREKQTTKDCLFYDILDELNSNDVLVIIIQKFIPSKTFQLEKRQIHMQSFEVLLLPLKIRKKHWEVTLTKTC